jgi:hypothetical protein
MKSGTNAAIGSVGCPAAYLTSVAIHSAEEISWTG